MTPHHVEQAVRFVGVAISALGLVVAAPNAFLELISTRWESSRQTWRNLAAYLPWSHPRVGLTVAVSGTVMASSDVRGRVHRTYPEAGSIAEQVELLREWAEELRALVYELERTAAAAEVSARQALSDLEGRLGGRIDDLSRELSEQDAQQQVIDGRGLVVTFVGLLLSGFSPEIAGWPCWVWVPLTLASGVWCLRSLLRAVRHGLAERAAS